VRVPVAVVGAGPAGLVIGHILLRAGISFSQGRLPAIWRTQAFSGWFLRILLASLRDGQEPGPAVPGGFARGLRDGWVHALQHDQLLARWFAHAYAGVDQEEPA
jgi:p-hydroxybenzoate 3-monooxygenase